MDNALSLAFRIQTAVGALHAAPSVQARPRPQIMPRKVNAPVKPGEFAATLEQIRQRQAS
ncbi:MAG: hypothetical protein EBV16_06350 [Betaproteobacteria bacterium]|nr:hypothetical protein [Betaproteobacteria bacterium]HAB48096.1 hypothetical protein [Lautropia sp.]NBP35718.1 hypothetical protein [Betaproteobacteria bacterium]NBP38006.1 hypothetical protein [Betaproteobacteria bacterium]NBS39868.1 hypothetical protein [Betaproteobacteria bacterium]